MKKLLSLVLVGITTVTLACNHSEQKEVANLKQEENITQINKNVNIDEFSKLIASEKGQILDVRTPEEWAEGTITGATKMNFFDADFNTQLSQLDKDKPVYVYCKSGGRSGKTATELEKMGFTKIYNLIGGITAWKGAKRELVK